MEIAPTARRRVWTARAATLLVVVVLAPVTILALVPTVFGLERYVMTGDAVSGSVERGALMFDRMVPASDLAVGDVVTYEPPASSGITQLITRRVVGVGDGSIQTRADTSSTPDPWSLDQRAYPAVSRLVVSVPYVGYPFLLAEGHSVWTLLLLGAGGVLVVMVAGDVRRSSRTRTNQPEILGV